LSGSGLEIIVVGVDGGVGRTSSEIGAGGGGMGGGISESKSFSSRSAWQLLTDRSSKKLISEQKEEESVSCEASGAPPPMRAPRRKRLGKLRRLLGTGGAALLGE